MHQNKKKAEERKNLNLQKKIKKGERVKMFQTDGKII
jgi:hypothetical protein